MADPIAAPIYVLTEWTVDGFNPGVGLPIITPDGVFVGDQTILDQVALSAGKNCVRLIYSTTRPPTAVDYPDIDRAFVRFDQPQELTSDQQEQGRENLGIRLYDTGSLV